ncbi:hypothetical protein D3C71_1103320 [compost metagenome]
MCRLSQGCIWPPAPVAVGTDGDATHFLLRCTAHAVVNNDHIVGYARAAQHRTRIVGAAIVIDRSGDLGDVIGDNRCRRRRWRIGVNDDSHRLGWRTLVARAVFVGDRQGDIVRAVWQRLSWRPGPGSVRLNGDHIGLFDAVNVDSHRVARRTGAA